MPTAPAAIPHVMPTGLASLIALLNRPNLLPVGGLDWDDLRYVVTRRCPFWFSAEAMRFFGTRLIGTPCWVNSPDGDRIIAFVTSERDSAPLEVRAWNGERRYTVRTFNGERIGSIGTFGEFRSRRDALRTMSQYVAID